MPFISSSRHLLRRLASSSSSPPSLALRRSPTTLPPSSLTTTSTRRRPRPFSSVAPTQPPPPSAAATPAGEGASAAEASSDPTGWGWKFKVAGFILGPLSIPVAFVTALVYDPEFRDDVDARFPEIVDYIRKNVGFEEDLNRRRTDLEKAFISSQPVGVNVHLQSGMRVSQTVSPLETLAGLYDAIQAHTHTGTQAEAELEKEGTIVALDFEDIAPEPIQDPSFRDIMAAEHPNDNLGIVPPPTRSINLPSLWDALAGDGGMVGDAIAMKKQREGKDNKQLAIEELERTLQAFNEEIRELQKSIQQGSARAIDDIENDIAYLKARRSEVKAQLRDLGKWWRW